MQILKASEEGAKLFDNKDVRQIHQLNTMRKVRKCACSVSRAGQWEALNLTCTKVDKIHLLFTKDETKNPKGPEKEASINSLKSISTGLKGKRDRSRCHRCAPVPQREGSNSQSMGRKRNRGSKTSLTAGAVHTSSLRQPGGPRGGVGLPLGSEGFQPKQSRRALPSCPRLGKFVR